MKTSCIVFALLASTLTGVQAQVAGSSATTIANQPALPAPTAYGVVANDANSRVWERTVYEQGPNGIIVPRKSRYTELCSGLNFWQNGQWQPSKEQIDILPNGGAAATKGAHQVYFPGDIAQGVIRMVTPDGLQLQSRPVGLFYEDDSNSALIAILTNSVGGLVNSNEVVYPDAFEGAAASLHYKYTRGGFEQDVVVQGQLPDPAALGLNPARTRLGVLTAFFDNNNPVATLGPVDAVDGLSDSTLTFGAMKMGHGQAFSIGNTGQVQPPVGGTPAAWENWITNATQQSSGGTPAYKRWFQLNGHNFLMEEVPYHRVAAQLEQLPAAAGRSGIIATNLFAANSILNGVSAKSLQPAQFSKSEVGNRNPKMARLSRAGWDKTPALVLDYVIVGYGDNYTFQGDTTYYINGTVTWNHSTVEGGAVLKYPSGAQLTLVYPPVWKASAYRPVIFTAIDDNTVGETISGSTGNPSGLYASSALVFEYPPMPMISNFRISHAQTAITLNEGGNPVFSDGQVVHCGYGFKFGSYSGGINLTNRNMLFANMGYICYYGIPAWPSWVYVQNTTFSSSGYELATSTGSGGLSVKNCIFANASTTFYGSVYLSGNNNGFYNSPPFGTSTFINTFYPFQTVGAGAYYLANGCNFFNRGTANIDPALLASLKQKTTMPPIVYSGVTFSTTMNFAPQANRDNSGTHVDLGYHYDPLDYIFHNCQVNSSMTFHAGTAVGWQGRGLSFSGANTMTMEFDGTASQPCYFVRCSTVQEADGSHDGTGIAGSSPVVVISAAFTRFSALGNQAVFFDADSIATVWVGDNYNFAPMCNCEFWSGAIGGNVNVNGVWFWLSNDLLDRTKVSLLESGSGELEFQNCTFHGGSLAIDAGAASPCSIRDCAFDATDLNDVNSFYSGCGSYNAYLSGATTLPGDQNDVTVGSFNWQSGPLGNFYLPIGSPLIKAGAEPADSIYVQVGNGNSDTLASFTTDPVNETFDSDRVHYNFPFVNIGYHYNRSQNLLAMCRPWWITLEWEIPASLQPYVSEIFVKRAVGAGAYSVVKTIQPDNDSYYTDWRYIDATIVSGTAYRYVVSYHYWDPFTSSWCDSDSNEATGSTCAASECSTPSYEPSFWNNNPTIQAGNNCYDYANNVRTDTYAQPGRASGGWCNDPSCYTAPIIYQYAVNDGLIETTKDAPIPDGMTKLLLVINPDPYLPDFHWYRRDASGLWSHKIGWLPATNLDNSQVTITNPEQADRGPYSVIAGYFLTCSSSAQGQGHADIQ